MPLWGRDCALLALAALACLSPAGDGPVRSQLSLLSPLFCELAWRCLRLGLFTGELSHSLVCYLKLVSSDCPWVLTLSNAACASLPSPRMLVVDVAV